MMEISSLRYIMVMERVFNVKKTLHVVLPARSICSNSYMYTLILIRNGTLLLYHVPFFFSCLAVVYVDMTAWQSHVHFKVTTLAGTLQIFVQFHNK
jgi:hypothetical protein